MEQLVDDHAYEFCEFVECVALTPWVSTRLLSTLSRLCTYTYLVVQPCLRRRRRLHDKWAPILARRYLRRLHRWPAAVQTQYITCDVAFTDADGPVRAIPSTDFAAAPSFASIRRITIVSTRPYAFYLILFGTTKKIPLCLPVCNWTLMPSGATNKLRDRQPRTQTPAGAYVAHVDVPPWPRSDILISYMATRARPDAEWNVRPDFELMWECITHLIVVQERA